LFKKKQCASDIHQEEINQIISQEIAASPLLATPASASQNHFAGFFFKKKL
jgi:hypothetical protein